MVRRLYPTKAKKSGSGVMEGDGEELWRLVRPAVRAAGPLKLLRRRGRDGYLHDRIAQVVE